MYPPAYMARLREMKPELSLPEELTPEILREWQGKVSAKYLELMQMPEFTGQPDPVRHPFRRNGHLLHYFRQKNLIFVNYMVD